MRGEARDADAREGDGLGRVVPDGACSALDPDRGHVSLIV